MITRDLFNENYNGEYDDEAGMAKTNLVTIARAAQGLLDTIDDQENLPEWVQEKIAKVQGMMVTAWDYLESQEAQGIDPKITDEDADPNSGYAQLLKKRAELAARKKLQGVAEGNLKEFAPGNGGGESGRWYTDDQITDIVGDGWYNDLDVSGDIPKQQMIQEAQAWLDDQGYNVQVLNCKVNDDDMEWYIEGSFQNSRFAKKGVAEGDKIGNMDADAYDSAMARLKKLAGSGPMKTVYDPNTRRYKNVPTAVQPAQQPRKK